MGALSDAGCDRAVAIADGYMGAWPASLDLYAAALERAGRPRTDGAIGAMPVWWVIAEDPEPERAKVGEAVDAASAVDQLVELAGRFPQLEDVHVFGALPGEPVDSATGRLRYVAGEVLPALRSASPASVVKST